MKDYSIHFIILIFMIAGLVSGVVALRDYIAGPIPYPCSVKTPTEVSMTQSVR